MAKKSVRTAQFYKAVQAGEDRLRTFRASRLMFMKQFAGQYYDRAMTVVGEEPVNLIFNAIATIVPNLVTNFPKTVVKSKFLAYRGYAELLGLGLDYLSEEIDLRTELRRWIVDAILTMGIMKTGIATSGSTVNFSGDLRFDPGQPYATVIDFDDFILDPACRRIEEAEFVGHRVRTPRQMLLDSGKYDNDLVVALPSSQSDTYRRAETANLSTSHVSPEQINDLQDLVDIREVWVPGANSVVWLPAGQQVHDKYLRIAEFDGPEEGPFTYLSLTPPLPNNPLPIAPVGIWYDLHIAANRMATKIIEQAERQKDIIGYAPAAADDAESIRESGDGDMVGMSSPDMVKTFSFGGQAQSNVENMSQLSYWFNIASGNTDQMSGARSDASTATQAKILEGNSQVRTEDMRDLVYQGTQKIMKKLAWYLHSDPLIALPLVKRTPIPAQTGMGPNGPVMLPPRVQEDQVILTPDVREGDFLDFHFSIEQKSMSRVDPTQQIQNLMLFISKVLPAAAQATMVCKQMGVAFSFPRLVTNASEMLDIDWMDEVFYDPQFQAETLDVLGRTPTPEGSKGESPGGGMAAILQNGQPGNLPFKGMNGGSEMTDPMANQVRSDSQPAEMGF